MGKRKTPESGGESTKKPTTGSPMQEDSKAEVEVEAPLPADVARDTMEQEQDEPQEQQERSDGSNVDEQEPHDNDNDEISKLKKKIADNEIKIANLDKKIDEHDTLKEILRVWHADPQKRIDLLSESTDLFVIGKIASFPLEQQRAKLGDYALGQLSDVRNLNGRLFLLQKENDRLKEQLAGLSQNSGLQFLPPETNETPNRESGIVYIEDKCRIEIAGVPSSSNIGLLTTAGRGFKLKDADSLNLTDVLKDAWSVLEIKVTAKKFLNQLLEKVPSLEKTFVTSAWRALCDEYDLSSDTTTRGEMFFQQCICVPFSKLLMAAGGKDGSTHPCYRADQDVKSSMSIIRKAREGTLGQEERMLCVKPDAAATLSYDWDAFGMMEIKAEEPCNDRDHLLGNDKCVLMTAATAMAIKDCITEKDYNKVRLPFIIVTGSVASLYVTVLDRGYPAVRVVGYPDNDNGKRCYMYTSPWEERTKLFVAFAVLLNEFKGFFEKTARVKYNENVDKRTGVVEKFDAYSPTNRSTKGTGDQSKDNESTGHGLPLGSSHEQCAQEAAQCGGKFLDLRYPFDTFLHFTDSGIRVDEQTVSPFFFRGRSTTSPTLLGVTPNQEVFLKVWKTDDVDIGAVHSEWIHHRRAFEAGVPVATPVLSELAKSTCSCGLEYLVLAVEFIATDDMKTMIDLWHFCSSLIKTVLTLHEKAGMVHCDLKPPNLRWNKGVVRLIDFEHAQDIANAAWAPGTDGFEAPEILEGMPCSTKTDAFSVGRIISEIMEAFLRGQTSPREQNQMLNILHEISLKLTDADPHQRWSLYQALRAMESESLPVNERMFVEVKCWPPTLLA